jgi:folylpolyglutamate synthase/dihydropteroate synthase
VTKELAPLADVAYVSPNSSARSAGVDRVAEGLRAGGVTDLQTFTTVEGALQSALAAAGEEDLILVTGSFYTVGDARLALASISSPPQPRGGAEQ